MNQETSSAVADAALLTRGYGTRGSFVSFLIVSYVRKNAPAADSDPDPDR